MSHHGNWWGGKVEVGSSDMCLWRFSEKKATLNVYMQSSVKWSFENDWINRKWSMVASQFHKSRLSNNKRLFRAPLINRWKWSVFERSFVHLSTFEIMLHVCFYWFLCVYYWFRVFFLSRRALHHHCFSGDKCSHFNKQQRHSSLWQGLQTASSSS